jgi:uncharacterized protein
MKTFVIYHRADFDGIFCREIARKNLGENAEFIGWDYNDPLPQVPATADLYMLDISVDGMMDHPRLIWIDHHKTAIEKYPATIPGYRIDGVAACRLAWQWFEEMRTRDPVGFGLPALQDYRNHYVVEPLAVRLAGEYDIWDKRDPRTDLFQHGLRSQDLTATWPALLDLGQWGETTVAELLKAGRVLEYARSRENESIIKAQGFTVDFEGHRFLALNTARCNSLTFTAGLTPEHEGCLSFNWNGRRWRVSLYGVPGRAEIDFTPIAKKYNGGGHRQACGFETNELPFLGIKT